MLLSLETAAYGNSSLALFDGENIVGQKFLSSGRATTIELLPAVQLLLEKAGAKKVDTIAVDCGPGSFTGIRVGIAAARGLADGWSSKVIGISQFDFYPNFSGTETKQLILIDAKAGGGFYYELRAANAQKKRGFILENEITGSLIDKNEKIVICGEFDDKILNGTIWKHIKNIPVADAEAAGRIAMKQIAEGNQQEAEAIYLHSTIKMPK